MRLIDADDRIEFIKNVYCPECDNYNGVRCRACPINDMIEAIDDAPTVDLWHYPSRGEYPTDGEETLIIFKHRGEKVFKVDKYSKQYNGWQFSPKPIAWQYIVPPKEEE